jgi:3-dehydroquinate dehydratase/shikimate dehydrogenase
LTVRRAVDGGQWTDGEGARLVLLSKGLAFADTDARKNFSYVDLESDLHAPSIEEAARTFRIRIIRSYHDIAGMPANCESLLRSLPRHPDELGKLAVKPQSVKDCMELQRAAENAGKMSRIVIGMGDYGLWTRVLADRLGSWMTYASPLVIGAVSAASGQVDPSVLLETFRFRSLNQETRFLADIGYPMPSLDLSRDMNEAFAQAGVNMAMMPMAVDSPADFLAFADFAKLEGFCVSRPYGFKIPVFCSSLGRVAARSRIVTGMRRGASGWEGFDLDTKSLAAALIDAMGGRKRPGMTCVVIGSGQKARSVILAAKSLGARVKVTDRALLEGGSEGYPGHCSWAGPDGDLLKALPWGRLFVRAQDPEEPQSGDPLPYYRFSKHDKLLDLSEDRRKTRFSDRAILSGCSVSGEALFRRERVERLQAFFCGVKEAVR